MDFTFCVLSLLFLVALLYLRWVGLQFVSEAFPGRIHCFIYLLLNWLYPLVICVGVCVYCLFLWDAYFNCPRMPIIIPVSQFSCTNLEASLGPFGVFFFKFISPEQHHDDPKQNYHTPGLDESVLCRLPSVFHEDSNISFVLYIVGTDKKCL